MRAAREDVGKIGLDNCGDGRIGIGVVAEIGVAFDALMEGEVRKSLAAAVPTEPK